MTSMLNQPTALEHVLITTRVEKVIKSVKGVKDVVNRVTIRT